jgi:hypothetical protein
MQQCLYCKKDIEDLTSNKNKKYCCDSCGNSYRQLKKEQTCLECNKKFFSPCIRKYCDDCKDKSHITKTKKCLFCGIEIIDTTKNNKRKFCSETCNNSYIQFKKEQVCNGCGIKFNHHIKRKYCDDCKWKYRQKKIEKKCLWCGKNLINKNYCSKDCHYNYNKQKYIDKAKEWKKKNPKKTLNINKRWKNKRYNEDPLYKINCNLRNHLRYVLINYTKNGKIYSTKKYGISVKRIIKRLERVAGFSFKDNPKKAIFYINKRELEHNIPIHKIFEIGKLYNNPKDPELLSKIKRAYSSTNISLMPLKEHRNKTSNEVSQHQLLKKYLKENKPMEIREVSREDANELVSFYHYSDVMPRATKLYIGGFLGEILIGVMTLGWGVQPKRTIKKIFPSLNQEDYFEIGKLCLDERMPKNSESKFMSLCFKHIKKNYPKIKLIYSWSDGLLGKPGFVYQASNFLYGGSIWSKRYFTKEGYKIHPRSSRYLCEDNSKKIGKKKLYWLTNDYMKLKGIKLYKGLQFRYCYFLCDDKEKKELLRKSKRVWNINYPKFEDLKWKVKEGERYVDSEQPFYSKSLNAQESYILI